MGKRIKPAFAKASAGERKDAGVVERDSLENCFARKCNEGSNPSLSANSKTAPRGSGAFLFRSVAGHKRRNKNEKNTIVPALFFSFYPHPGIAEPELINEFPFIKQKILPIKYKIDIPYSFIYFPFYFL